MKILKCTNSVKPILVDEDHDKASIHNWCLRGACSGNISRVEHPYIALTSYIMGTTGIRYDHKNRDPFDSQRDNLRECTNSQNQMNRGKQDIFKGSTSDYKGVHWDKDRKKWRVVIYYKNNKVHIGYFKDELEAAKSYNKAALQYHKEFACINKIIEV